MIDLNSNKCNDKGEKEMCVQPASKKYRVNYLFPIGKTWDS